MTLFRFIVIHILILCAAAELTAKDHRGLWVVRYALTSEAEMREIVNTALDLRITDLYVQVYALGQAWYPSAVAPVANAVKQDEFGRLVKIAREKGLKVHAWLNVFYIWAGKTPPANPEHVFNRRRHSILNPPVVNSFKSYTWFLGHGVEGYFIDPADKAYLERIKDLISELIFRYDIEGIHLDYLRYPQREVTFSVTGRTLFRDKYFADPFNIVDKQNSYIKEYGLDGIADFYGIYKNFLNKNIYTFLKNLRNHLKQLDKDALLTCAVKADPIQAKEVYYQNWPSWIKDNLCDELLLMNYTEEKRIFKEILSRVGSISGYKNIRIGIAAHKQTVDSLLEKIRCIETSEFEGYVLFSYNYLRDHPAYLNRLYQGITAIKNSRKSTP